MLCSLWFCCVIKFTTCGISFRSFGLWAKSRPQNLEHVYLWVESIQQKPDTTWHIGEKVERRPNKMADNMAQKVCSPNSMGMLTPTMDCIQGACRLWMICISGTENAYSRTNSWISTQSHRCSNLTDCWLLFYSEWIQPYIYLSLSLSLYIYTHTHWLIIPVDAVHIGSFQMLLPVLSWLHYCNCLMGRPHPILSSNLSRKFKLCLCVCTYQRNIHVFKLFAFTVVIWWVFCFR